MIQRKSCDHLLQDGFYVYMGNHPEYLSEKVNINHLVQDLH